MEERELWGRRSSYCLFVVIFVLGFLCFGCFNCIDVKIEERGWKVVYVLEWVMWESWM